MGFYFVFQFRNSGELYTFINYTTGNFWDKLKSNQKQIVISGIRREGLSMRAQIFQTFIFLMLLYKIARGK